MMLVSSEDLMSKFSLLRMPDTVIVLWVRTATAEV